MMIVKFVLTELIYHRNFTDVKTNRQSPPTDDRFVEDYRRLATKFANTNNPAKMAENLSWKGKKALRWLENEIREEHLIVSEADKDGAILLLDPKHVHEAVYERLSSDDFELLGPTDQLNQITHGFARAMGVWR